MRLLWSQGWFWGIKRWRTASYPELSVRSLFLGPLEVRWYETVPHV